MAPDMYPVPIISGLETTVLLDSAGIQVRVEAIFIVRREMEIGR